MSAAEALLENLPERGIEPASASEAAVRLRLAQREQPKSRWPSWKSVGAEPFGACGLGPS